MKKIIKSLLISGLALLVTAGPVRALTDTVTISDLPEYTRSDNFNLSYSALSDNITGVQFCYHKEGDPYQAFGPVFTTASGQVQVTGSQINEQVKYYFMVVLNGTNCSGVTSAETSVFFDISGPSPIQNYWKERIAPGTYRLHWKNPGDSDFSRTFIYRSENPQFDANNSTKIGELGGAPDDEMTYDDFGLDPDKNYYYAFRAVDKAGNPASLVSDQETIYEEEVVVAPAGEGEVSVLPREGDEGQVLGDEEGAVDEDELTAEEKLGIEPSDGVLGDAAEDNIWKRLRTGIVVLGAVYIVWRFFFRKKK